MYRCYTAAVYIHAHTATLGVELLNQQLKGRREEGTCMGDIYVLCIKTYMQMLYRCYAYTCTYGRSPYRARRPTTKGEEGDREGVYICAMHKDVYICYTDAVYIHAHTAALRTELLAQQLKGRREEGTCMGYIYVLCMKTFICI